ELEFGKGGDEEVVEHRLNPRAPAKGGSQWKTSWIPARAGMNGGRGSSISIDLRRAFVRLFVEGLAHAPRFEEVVRGQHLRRRAPRHLLPREQQRFREIRLH